jgi:glycosyltransferase involved in cell wall biosynthesis
MVIDAWREPFNGTVVSTRRFAEALEAAGHHVDILAILPQGAKPTHSRSYTAFDQLSVPGFNRLINSMRAPLASPDRARLRQALAACDLLHVQFPFFLGHAAVVEARRLGVPVVCSFHVQPENIQLNIGLRGAALRRWLYRLFAWAFYDRADVVVAPSPFAADLLRAAGVTRPIRVVSNGVPDDFFKVRRGPSAPSDGRLRLLSVGRLAKEKGQEALLRAVAASTHRDRIDLTLAGAGPRQEALVALAKSLNLEARIGPVSDAELMNLYATSDLLVHCGAVELEGMSVLEAMATGLPVLISDSPDSALSQLITDPDRRFRSHDAPDLTAKLDAWLDRPDDLAAQGRANRAFAQGFSHAASVQALLKVYGEALGADATARDLDPAPRAREERVG